MQTIAFEHTYARYIINPLSRQCTYHIETNKLVYS